MHFPTLNASLNLCAFLFLLAGWIAVKNNNRSLHKKLMTGALVCSVLFLVCYVYYHMTSHMVTRYTKEGFIRGVYFFILLTHTPLAVLIVPFCIKAVWHAVKGEFDKHTKITRWLWPVWIYVSLTGVVIYLMLYIF